ncbi:MAG TPA: alpha/beta fold hydrolase, partial [Acetobacteraceae bacterium]|nr:alpha/beta fold hydrolase [Acetobacteraceae bacterium]
MHNSIPSGGGFEEGTPLLCVHPSPLSGRVFRRFLPVAGVGRSVFAPDLPGFGDSDPPSAGAGVPEHAAALGDFLDTMRLRQIDLLGHRFGALVAAELAATRPEQVRRLVLVSPPLAAEAAEPLPPTPAADGGHLPEEWRRAQAHSGPGAAAEVVSALVAERLRNSAAAAAAAVAEREFRLHPRLAQISMPLLVVRLSDDVGAYRGQAREVPARARLVEL